MEFTGASLRSRKQLLIGAWVAPAPRMKQYKNKNLITKKSYRLLKESGINCIYALYDMLPDYNKDVFRALKYCKKYNIRYLVRDKNCILGNVNLDTDYFRKYIEHPACAGVLFADEPGIEDFEQIRDAWRQFRKHTRDKMFYLNLLPVYAQNNQFQSGASAWKFGNPRGTREEYAHYIEEYLSVVHPEYISYDYYPMEGAFPNITEDHFWQLSYIRKKTQEEGIPFYCFIQCCSWNPELVRDPGGSEILWQVSSAVLYGCKGIQYFTFLNPFEDALVGSQFIGNLMDSNGKATEKMSVVKSINEHLNAIGADIMNSRHVGIMGEVASWNVPQEDVLTSFGPLAEVAAPCIAGCFQQGDACLYYVMNPGLTESAPAQLQFTGVVSAQVVQGGRISQFNGDCLIVQTEPGEGILVKIESR